MNKHLLLSTFKGFQIFRIFGISFGNSVYAINYDRGDAFRDLLENGYRLLYGDGFGNGLDFEYGLNYNYWNTTGSGKVKNNQLLQQPFLEIAND